MGIAGRRAIPILLLVVPALGLGVLGLALVAAAPARAGAAGLGAAQHFAWRQAIGLALGLALGATAAWLGPARLLAAAPKIFVVALLGAAAVFVPRLGVLAAGARRWVHLGPISGSPSPLLAGAVALWLAAAESGPAEAPASTDTTRVIRRRAIAVAGSLLAVMVMALEPDFSAAATTLVVAFATVAAAGRVPARRLVPVAALLLALLAGGALRSAYVDNRIRGFVSPERDPRGKGFEVLALAHANAAAGAAPAGLGRGRSRHRLSSSASDYAFALVTEELGRTGALAVLTCWAAIGLGVLAAAHGAARRHDVGGRALAAGLGTALLVPAALHVAVCRGWLPIIGVTMPLLS
ncbi:MAG TPA: FtsW/RodA/SpoVE family cell cycle protein, partial [Polyangia bacterium]|nr:FtsW/RodA/SpoVE family cell cycle protein [Polyangia bacterium]